MALTKEELDSILKQSSPAAAAPSPAAAEEPAIPGTTLYPSAKEKLEATTLGTIQGATKSTATMGGMMTGLRGGQAAAPFLGPLGPAAPVVGALGGATAGYFLGEGLDRLIFDDMIAAQRPDVAPYREGGKTFGESIAAAPWLFSLPTMTGNRVSRFISNMGEQARKTPKSFLAAETVSAVPAGVVGGTIYSIDPEARGTRMAGEVTAGMLTPTRLVLGAVTGTVDALKNAGIGAPSIVKRGMAENKAAAELQRILTAHGEDVPTLIRLLEKPLPGGVPTPTSAQKTGKLVVSEIERALGNLHLKFAADTDAQGKQAIRAYTLLIDRLKDVGTPEALTQAAKIRATMFDNMIDARLATADKNAADRIVKIRRDTPEARAEIGSIIQFETSLALNNAREAERSLWQEGLAQIMAPVKTKVPKDELPYFETTVGAERRFDNLPPKLRKLPDNTRLVMFSENNVEKTVLASSPEGKAAIERLSTKLSVPELTATNTYNAFLKRASEIGTATYETSVPKVVRDIMQELGATRSTVSMYKAKKDTPEFFETGVVPALGGSYKPRPIPVGELINYRSDLLALARQAAGRGETNDANFYGMLADAMLQDLGQLKSPAFDNARDFSRALNDVFTRTFAGNVAAQSGVTTTGAARVPPETLVTKAFGQNADVTAQRMNEIESAVGFLRTQYDQAVAKFGKDSDQARMLAPLADLSGQGVVSIQDAQSRVMRLMAMRTVDPISGKVNPGRLQQFVNENKPMLDKLGLTNDMSDAVTAELAAKMVANQNSWLNRVGRAQTAFAQVLKGGENPTNAVLDVINGKNPVLGMNRMVQLAQSGGQDAVDGLKSTIFDYAFTKAGGIDKFDPVKFREALFAPLGPNKPSLMGMLRQHNIVSFGDMRNVNELVRPMIRIQQAMDNRQALDQIASEGGPVTDLALRIIGSKLGASIAGHQGPGTLVAAGAGSKAMRAIFDKMPSAMTRAVLEDAMRDPALMALLLKKNLPSAQQNRLAYDITARLVSSGVFPASMMNLVEQQPAQQQQQPSAAQMLRSLPPAPPTKGVPTAPAAAPAAPAKGAAPAGKMSMAPEDQNKYQALFPQDPISSLMAMQPVSG